jgi:preprotein translocase subunit YajC
MLFALLLWAEEQQQQPNPMQGPGNMLIIMVALFVFMWLFIIRPDNRRRQAEALALLEGLERNDQIPTTSGIYCTIVSVDPKDEDLTVKLEGDNVRMKIIKTAVARNLTKEKQARAAQAEKEAAK